MFRHILLAIATAIGPFYFAFWLLYKATEGSVTFNGSVGQLVQFIIFLLVGLTIYFFLHKVTYIVSIFTGIIKDVTERKRLEIEHIESEIRYVQPPQQQHHNAHLIPDLRSWKVFSFKIKGAKQRMSLNERYVKYDVESGNEYLEQITRLEYPWMTYIPHPINDRWVTYILHLPKAA